MRLRDATAGTAINANTMMAPAMPAVRDSRVPDWACQTGVGADVTAVVAKESLALSTVMVASMEKARAGAPSARPGMPDGRQGSATPDGCGLRWSVPAREQCRRPAFPKDFPARR